MIGVKAMPYKPCMSNVVPPVRNIPLKAKPQIGATEPKQGLIAISLPGLVWVSGGSL